MTVTAKMDTSSFDAGVARLQGELRVKLADSMAEAGGEVIRDEAKLLAPEGTGSHSQAPGTLKAAIYVAHNDKKSNPQRSVYSVSWNHGKAPHGHLIEFGHWQPYKVVRLSNGDWFTTKELLPSPEWISAHPFLRPAFDSARQRAMQAMIERGRKRLPELLSESHA